MRFRIIDAFADAPFTGNPAAVFLLDQPDWPDTSWLQQVAQEMSVSETAFAYQLPPDGRADWALRWFTPLVEDTLCGHATLAVAHALHADRGSAATVRFETRSGVLTTVTDDCGVVTMDFPRPQLTPGPAPGVAEALGATPEQTLQTGALGDVLAVFSSEDDVRQLRPDFTALADLQTRTARPDRGVIVTAHARDSADGYDFVSRFFTPAAGVPEDPATGSAHTALAPYWSARLGRNRLTGLQVSRRTGKITTTLSPSEVRLSGRAVVVTDGQFLHG
ncbi:MAG: PhzF family phenazine biosynthesis protein [Jatrophihabitans sp.]|uniref:PhzF family phenazine biosynthesis protein n=1 Tax=Jatrophihabitans sp. TaxID=1932789 RepID=UPI00391531BC